MSLLELARQALNQGDFAACIKYTRGELARNPANAELLWLASVAHFQSGQAAKARLLVSQLIALLPEESSDLRSQYMLLGMACSQVNDFPAAAEAFGKLLAVHPTSALALSMLSRLAYAQGETDVSRQYASRFMSLLPDIDLSDSGNRSVEFGKTLYLCSMFVSEELAGEWLNAAQGFLQLPGCEALSRDEAYCFGLAVMQEKAGDFAGALFQFRAGNAARRQASGYQVEGELAIIGNDIDNFDEAYFAADNSAAVGEEDPVPVFILGMPRSGSSLLEQILASHSEVTACGEQMWLVAAFRDALESRAAGSTEHPAASGYDAGFFSEVRRRYLKAASLDSGTRFFTDKMPGNIYKLWLAAKAFPEARFIVTERDKLATVMSCFTTAFSSGNGFAEDINDCARMYDATRELAAHWHRMLPDRVYRQNYDRLVTDTVESIDELFTFLGANPEPACYEPHKLQRNVATSSTLQVQRPVYKEADERWLEYMKHLGDDNEIFA